MKKTIKQKLISTALLFVTSLSLTFLGTSLLDTKAEPLFDSETKIATNGFSMTDIATIRLQKNSSGIRWETKVDKTFVTDLETEYEGYTMTFHTLVRPYQDNHTLTPDSSSVKDYEYALDELFVSEDEAEYSYRAAITYDNLTTQDQQDKAYAMELSARSYVKLSQEGKEDVIIYAQDGDNTRSVQAVANMLLITNASLGDNAIQGDNLTTLQSYVAENPTRLTESAGYYVESASNTYQVADIANGTYRAYFNSKLVDKEVVVDGGNFTVDTVDGADGAKTLSLMNKDNVYSMPITVATDRIEMFSAMDGVSMGSKTLASALTSAFGSATLTAQQGNNALTVESGNVVKGVQANVEKDENGYSVGIKDTDITVTDGATDKVFVLEAYSKVIDEADDLAFFNLNFEAISATKENPATDKTGAEITSTYIYVNNSVPFDGYYILSKNIDASNYEHAYHGYNTGSMSFQGAAVWVYDAETNTQTSYDSSEKYGLIGTFDGNGYTIDGLTNKNGGGFFGLIGYKGIVKNVAFTNMNIGSNWAAAGLSGRISDGAKLQNIYMHATTIAAGSLFARSICSGAIMENCVIELDGKTGGSGTLFAEDQAKADVATWKNNYVISPVKLYESSSKTVDASNQTITGTGYNLSGFKRYENRTEMAAASNTFEGFNQFWDISTGVPLWISATNFEVSINDGAASVEMGLDEKQTLTVTLNGLKIANATLTVTEGEAAEIIDGQISPIKSGDATVKASVIIGGKEYSDEILINVAKTETTYEDTIALFSVADGVSMGQRSFATILTEEFGTESFELTQGETKLTYETGVVSGVKESLVKEGNYTTGVNAITITATGETKIIHFTVMAYTKVIDEATDLEMFKLNFEAISASTENPATDKTGAVITTKTVYAENSTPFDGYYILSKNIDASAYTHANQGGIASSMSYQDGRVYVYDAATGTQTPSTANNYGLIGTFDGDGYTISGATFEREGLFGIISPYGTVKNVAFTDVNFGSMTSATTLAARIADNAKLSNLYIQADTLSGNSKNGSLISNSICSKAVIENCVFEVTNANGKSGAHGVLYTEDQPKADVSTWTNSFVISPVVLYTNGTKTADAGNKTVTGEGSYNLSGFKRYDTSASMIEEKEKNTAILAEFDKSGLWDTSTGIPVWNTAN